MKRAGKILSLIALIVVVATSVCFAEAAPSSGLVLESTYPADGATGTAIENFSVKLYFNHNITDAVSKQNEDKFTLTGPEGEVFPTIVLYPEKEDGVVLVLMDNSKLPDKDGDGRPDISIQSNSVYTLQISGSMVDNAGNTLGEDRTISFTTQNQKATMTINMVMMVVMFGGMMFFSTRQAKKAAEDAKKQQRDAKVNPYKEAKRTGKSVEEIVEKDQRDKAKKAAKEAKKAAREEDDYEWIDADTYRVARPRPISAGGSTYVTGRKAIYEAKKAAEAERKAKIEASKKRQVKKGKGRKK